MYTNKMIEYLVISPVEEKNPSEYKLLVYVN